MGFARTLFGMSLAVASWTAQAVAEDQMPWQPTVEAAQQIAARTNRLVLLHFWGPSCQPCLRLEHEVFSKPEVGRALDPHFVMVKLNVDQAPGTAQMYGVSSIPTDVITLPNGQLVSEVHCPPTAGQYVAQLCQAAAGHRALLQNNIAQATGPTAPAAAVAAAAPNAAAPQAYPVAGAAPDVAQQPLHPNDRYAEYFPQQQQQAVAANAGAAPPSYPAQTPPQFAAAPQVPAAAAAPYGQVQPAAAPYGQQPGAMQASYPQGAAPQPPGTPPMGLDGYCPVTLVERQQWTLGDARFGAVHRGRTYLFLGPNEVKKFLADPDKFAPVLAGHDPVLAMDNQQMVPGRREFGVYSDNRVYLFADEASRRRFEQNPRRYTAEALQMASQPRMAR
ncbi:MAG: thioredoxin family protein [Pirellulales bacterium]